MPQIEWSESSGLGIIRLNRPEKLNALTHLMMNDLVQICKSVRDRTDIRAVLLIGEGRSFCSGQDLNEPKSEGTPISKLAVELRSDVQSELASLPQPTIAALQGHVLGRGLMLALACDVRIAADDVKLGFPEVKFGIIPGGGGTQRLVKVIGTSRAKHMVLTGQSVNADLAMQWGLVTQVVPRSLLDDEAISLAKNIVALPGHAAIFAKVAVEFASSSTLDDGVKFEQTLSSLLTSSGDWERNRGNFGTRE